VTTRATITTPGKASGALAVVDEPLAGLLDLMPDGIVLVDAAGLIVFANVQAEALFVYTPGSMRGKPMEMLIPERFRVVHGEHLTGYFRRPHMRLMGTVHDFFGLRADGSEFPAEISLSPLKTAQGTLVMSAVRDVSERKRLECIMREKDIEVARANEAKRNAERLRESELRFRQLAENIDEVFWLTEPAKDKILYVSPAYAEIWGQSCESLYASPMDWITAIHPEDRERVLQSARTKQARGEFLEEYRIVRPDGAIRWIRDRAFPVFRKGHEVHRIAGVAQDITERKRMEDAMRASEGRYRVLFEGNPLPLWVYDLETLRFLDVNEAATRTYGYTRDEFLAMTIRDIRPTADVPRLEDSVREGERDPGFSSGLWRHRLKDGTFIDVDIVSHEVRYKGRRTRFVCPVDVTSRIAAEAAVRKSVSHLNEAQRNARIGSWRYVPGGPLLWSDQMYELYKLPRDVPPTYEATRTVIHSDDRSEGGKAFERAFASGALDYTTEYRVVWPDGQTRTLCTQGKFRRGADGRVIDAVGTVQDVTIRKHAEDEIRRLNEELQRHAASLEQRVAERTSELEAANKELESFDYSVSHDLRAPLNRIRGFSAMLLEEYAASRDERGIDLLRRIDNSGRQMDELIGDLMQLSMVAAGELRRTNLDVSQLALSVLAGLRKAHPERKVEWAVEPGLTARADPGLVRIVLENLLGNAWKFTGKRDRAVIEMGCDRSVAHSVAYFVRDNGAGFDGANAWKLFAPFQRLHARADFEGTGIGLATVQRIVHRHGGKVWVQAEEDRGATFHFTLAP
jgi:PAS domain S-box-containing protein